MYPMKELLRNSITETERRDMNNTFQDTERRAGTRIYTAQRIKYTLNHSSPGGIFSGLMINMSHSGLCVYTHNFLAEGQIITLNRMLSNSCQKAKVCWTRKIDDISSIVGFQCC